MPKGPAKGLKTLISGWREKSSLHTMEKFPKIPLPFEGGTKNFQDAVNLLTHKSFKAKPKSQGRLTKSKANLPIDNSGENS